MKSTTARRNHNQQDYMKIKSEADTDGRAVAITIAIFCLIGLAAILLSSLGCVALFGPPAEESQIGDPYSEVVRKEGGTSRMHFRDGSDLGDEVWCQWHFGSAAAFATVAFDRAEWEAWQKPIRVEDAKVISFDSVSRKVEVNGHEIKQPPEPRAKWVRYDFRALISAPSAHP